MGGTGRPGRVQARASVVTREQVYGRRPVYEALRGPREVLELWATERAVAAEPWLRDGVRVHVKPDREVSEAAGTRDHQGVLAWCEPYRYADAYGSPRATGRSSPASTRSLIRATSAPCCAAPKAPGRPGWSYRRTARPRHARCLPRIGRGGRASSRRRGAEPGAVPERDQACGSLDLRRGRRGRTGHWSADLSGGLALVFGAEGKGVRPLVRRACDATISIPLAGRVLIAERQRRRGAAAALRGTPAERRWLSRRCTSSTATTCCTPAASATAVS